jgi:short-subunit dehydrogenase
MEIKDKTVVLTGATGGIGEAIASRLDAEGARLILVGRNPTRLRGLIERLSPSHHRAVAADLATSEGRGRVVEACRTSAGEGVSLLVNGAGVNDFEFLEAQSEASIRQLVDVNLTSPILLCHAMLPLLRLQPNARIVNIGSTFGSIGYPGFSAYCASKFGLRGFTEALRRELDGSGISVSYVAPRATRTDLNSRAVVEMNTALGTAMDDPALVADAVMSTIRASRRSDRYLGWPEKLFVRVNALFPRLVDNSLRKQLPIIRRFAADKA